MTFTRVNNVFPPISPFSYPPSPPGTSTVSLLLNRNIDSDDEKKSAWLISPNLMTPVLCISLKMISFHSFLWLNSTPLCIYNIAFLIGSLLALSVSTEARRAMDTGVRVSVTCRVELLWVHPRSGTTGSHGHSVLFACHTCLLISTVATVTVCST